MRESHSFRGQTVEVRCLCDFIAIRARVKAQIVGHHHKHVVKACSGLCLAGACQTCGAHGDRAAGSTLTALADLAVPHDVAEELVVEAVATGRRDEAVVELAGVLGIALDGR